MSKSRLNNRITLNDGVELINPDWEIQQLIIDVESKTCDVIIKFTGSDYKIARNIKCIPYVEPFTLQYVMNEIKKENDFKLSTDS
jgi:hypothetical protein